ncbi:hypothetical protein Trydic_g19989 [Trypoxylus dichotomus]
MKDKLDNWYGYITYGALQYVPANLRKRGRPLRTWKQGIDQYMRDGAIEGQRKTEAEMRDLIPTTTSMRHRTVTGHHPAQLQGVAKTLKSRSQRLAGADHIRTESSEIKHILRINGFTTDTLNSENKVNGHYHLYNQSESPLDKGYNGQHRKIGEILNNPKDKMALEPRGVYEIPCRNCNLSYIGQTNRKIIVRKEKWDMSKTDNLSFNATRTDDWTQNRLQQ